MKRQVSLCLCLFAHIGIIITSNNDLSSLWRDKNMYAIRLKNANFVIAVISVRDQ